MVLSSKIPLLENLQSHSFAYLFFTGSFILSLIRQVFSFISALICSFIHAFIHLPVHLFIRVHLCSFIHPSFHLFIHSLIQLSMIMCSSMHSFICSFTCLSTRHAYQPQPTSQAWTQLPSCRMPPPVSKILNSGCELASRGPSILVHPEFVKAEMTDPLVKGDNS